MRDAARGALLALAAAPSVAEADLSQEHLEALAPLLATTPDDEPPPVLCELLRIAVPMWIERLRALPWEERRARATAVADVVAHGGDLLIPDRRCQPGQRAKVFNAVAEGLALLALQPGGARFGPLRFECPGTAHS